MSGRRTKAQRRAQLLLLVHLAAPAPCLIPIFPFLFPGSEGYVSITTCDDSAATYYGAFDGDTRLMDFKAVAGDAAVEVKERASFRLDFNKYFLGYVSLNHEYFTKAYVRHAGHRLRVNDEADSDLYRRDASYLLIAAPDASAEPTLAPTGDPPVSSIEKDILLHYKLDDGQGRKATDSGPDQYDATLGASGLSWVNGIAGGAMRFAGGLFRIPNFGDTAANDISFSLWALPTATHTIDREVSSGNVGLEGKRYVLFPPHGALIKGENNAGT